MANILLKSVFQGAVHGQIDATIEITSQEAAELRAALEIVDKYKSLAMGAIKTTKIDGIQHSDPSQSDWCMVEYAVKNDKVIVSVKDGMAG